MSEAGILSTALFSMLLGCALSADLPAQRLYVDYSARPDAAALLAHDLCILDPAANTDLQRGQEKGHVYLAYVSAVEVIPGTPNAAKAAARGIPTLAHNKEWGADVLDVTHAAWLDFVIEDLATTALAKGYDGVFLDTLDSTAHIVAAKPRKAQACHDALVTLVKRLRARFPLKRIVLNRGFDLLEETAGSINGVVLEGLFQTGDATARKYHAVSPSDTEWLLARIRSVQKRKLRVFVIDYVAPDNPALARRTAARIAALGCIPFITTPDLRGIVLAPEFHRQK